MSFWLALWLPFPSFSPPQRTQNVKFLRTKKRDNVQMFNKSEHFDKNRQGSLPSSAGRAAEEPGRGSAPGSVVGDVALGSRRRCAADLCPRTLARRRTPIAPCARRPLRPRCRGCAAPCPPRTDGALRTLRSTPTLRAHRASRTGGALRSVRTPSRHGRCAAPGLLGGSGMVRHSDTRMSGCGVCFFLITQRGSSPEFRGSLIHKETTVTHKHIAAASPPPPPPSLARVRAVSSGARVPLRLRRPGRISSAAGALRPPRPLRAPGLACRRSRVRGSCSRGIGLCFPPCGRRLARSQLTQKNLDKSNRI